MLPLTAKIAGAIGTWLAPAFGDGLRLWFDADQVDALSADREALRARVAAADFSDREREAGGATERVIDWDDAAPFRLVLR